MEQGYMRLGSWRGVPLLAHWSVLLFFPWQWLKSFNWLAAGLGTLAFVLILLVHELGHAAVALWRGVRVREVSLFFLHGRCRHALPYHQEDHILIAWGGVAAQLLLFLLAGALWLVLEHVSLMALFYLYPLLKVLLFTNLMIMAFNLLPVEPLDGYMAWKCLRLVRPWLARRRQRAEEWKARGQPSRRERKAQSERVVVDIMERMRRESTKDDKRKLG